ncbi:MAG: BlaI/MecI/CopY family transcriptional regulator [Saprospiraceae bacterium]|nr:BlaI/MecI/CopY family transcriptional regulator [Saprospiraceae bacterium]
MTLSPLEEEIMTVFWKLDKAFPKEVIAHLEEPASPYNTVLSTIRKLEKEGWLDYHVFGKTHQYFPVIKKEDFTKSVFSKLYHQFMGGNKTDLLRYFMEAEDIDIKELEQLVKSLRN